MKLKWVNYCDKPELEFIEKLYIESFPPEERRPIIEMYRLIQNKGKFNVLLLSDNENLNVGFIIYWQFTSFVFLEHFAIKSLYRNAGYGKKAIQRFLEYISQPLVGEIELPQSSELAMRRSIFYERLHFKLWDDIIYEQPPYDPQYEPIPMNLITYGDIDLKMQLDEIKNQLQTYVYKNQKV